MMQSQINVVFAGIDSKLWESDVKRWADAVWKIGESGGKIWYIGQEHDYLAKRNAQFIELENHLTNDQDKYSCWVFVENTASGSRPEIQHMAKGIKYLIFEYREGFASFTDVARDDHLDFFFNAVDTSVFITIAKAATLTANDFPMQ